jgi:hypothetical protein
MRLGIERDFGDYRTITGREILRSGVFLPAGGATRNQGQE